MNSIPYYHLLLLKLYQANSSSLPGQAVKLRPLGRCDSLTEKDIIDLNVYIKPYFNRLVIFERCKTCKTKKS